ncbi:MAG: PhoU domain-containing protein [Asgard group archaeon]|nr:PhoU domain-containing protein [Asgard group archaeon]
MIWKKKESKFGGTIRFKERMEELIKRLTELCELTLSMIQEGLEAIIKDKEELFGKLKAELDIVHEHCDKIESTVLESLALHQPFAKDLRYIIALLKISNEIHRSAHDAVHIAHSTKFVEIGQQEDLLKRIIDLNDKALSMFDKSVKAFVNQKEMDITEWSKHDDEIDELHQDIITDITKAIEKEPDWARAGMSLGLTTRYIERIADHACNIVEEGNFVVTSKREKIL